MKLLLLIASLKTTGKALLLGSAAVGAAAAHATGLGPLGAGALGVLLSALLFGLGVLAIASSPEQTQIESQARNGSKSFGAVQVTTLTGAVTLPNRPASLVGASPANYRTAEPGVAQEFIVTFSGVLTGAVVLSLPLGTTGNGWLPGDVVNVQATAAIVTAHALTVQDAGSIASNVGIIPTTTVTSGHVRAQLNAGNTHWIYLTSGGL
jgi:hypothetical protein